MDAALHTVHLPEIQLETREILRYAMLPRSAPVPDALPLDECVAAARGRVRCRAVWRRYPLRRADGGLDLGFAQTPSASLQRHLAGCGDILLFACTAGSEMDRLIARGKLLSPAHGLLMHAIGAQQVEGACDLLCRQLAEAFPDRRLTARYSPGYGDLPLSLQRALLTALDCERTIGVGLTESLLMTPTKSVTAIIGLKARDGA